MMAPRLLPLTIPDLPAVAAVWRAAWASANPAAAVVAPLDHWLGRATAEFGAPQRTELAWQGDLLAGFFVLDAARPYLAQLCVLPSRQGQGLGAALLQAVDQRLPHGWSLHVAEDNLGACRFYVRHGLRAGALSVHPVSGRLRRAYHRDAGPTIQ